MKTWRKVALVGFVASALAAGCVVGSGDDDDDADGVGGSTATGGRGGGGGTGGTPDGGGTGGAGGSGGSAGGAAGSGGTGGTGGSSAIQCDPTGTLGGTLGSCVPTDTTDTCQTCIQAQCCNEWNKCVARNPNNPCGFGGPAGETNGEIGCFQECVVNLQLDGGVASKQAIAACAGGCATPGCGTIADTTNDLSTCLTDKCFAPCLEVQ